MCPYYTFIIYFSPFFVVNNNLDMFVCCVWSDLHQPLYVAPHCGNEKIPAKVLLTKRRPGVN